MTLYGLFETQNYYYMYWHLYNISRRITIYRYIQKPWSVFFILHMPWFWRQQSKWIWPAMGCFWMETNRSYNLLPNIRFFSACINISLCLQEYQSWESCIHSNSTNCCRLKLSFGFHEIDLIHGFRVEIMEKTWHINNLIYSILD